MSQLELFSQVCCALLQRDTKEIAVQARNVFAPAVLLMRRDHPLAEFAKQVASRQEPAPFQRSDLHGGDDGK